MGAKQELLKFMNQMRVEQLFEEGKYMVIYVNPETSTFDELGFNLWDIGALKSFNTCEEMGQSAFDQWQSLIIVTGSPYRIASDKFNKFNNKVRAYNQLPPFNWRNVFAKFTIHIPIYAAHLYDSVILYAKALDKMIKDRQNNNETVDIAKLARNGSGITETIIKMGRYESISGSFIKIDKNGDSEGNFTAYALKPHHYEYPEGCLNSSSELSCFTCHHYPVQVGEFRGQNISNMEQLWKYDDNTMKLINKNGAWEYLEKTWNLPAEGQTGPINDTKSSQVLGLFGFDSTIDGAKVILEAADNSAEQMWYRGTQNSEGYFTLQNPVSRKFLTAKSQKITTITDQQSEIKYEAIVNIDFVKLHKPVDEPHCGYDGTKCPHNQNQWIYSAIILGVFLFLLLGVTLSMYRKWRVDQEIEGLLWRIDPQYLEGYHAMQSYPSTHSLASARSADSCFMNGREDGRYNGARVRIKLIHFGKKREYWPKKGNYERNEIHERN